MGLWPRGALLLFLPLLFFWTKTLTAEGLEPLASPVKLWQKPLEDLEAQLRKVDLGDPDLLDLRSKALDVRGELDSVQASALARAATLERDLEALGSAPSADEPKEPQGLRERRKRLESEMALAQAATKETLLIRGRIDRLLDDIKAKRREIFAQAISTRTLSPLDADLWAKAVPEWGLLLKSAPEVLTLKPEAFGDRTGWVILALLALLLGCAFGLNRALKPALETPPADELEALGVALGRFASGTLIALGVLGLFLTHAVLESSQTLRNQALLDFAGTAAVIVLIQAFFRALLQAPPPLSPLFWQGEGKERQGSRLIFGFAFLFLGFSAAETILRVEDASLEAAVVAQVVLSLLAALFLFPALKILKGPGAIQRLVRILTALVMAAIVIAILSGYVALGRLLATRGVLSLGIWIGVRMLFDLAGALRRALEHGSGALCQRLRQRFDVEGDDAEILAFWFELILKSVILGLALLLLLFLWSLDRKDLVIFLSDSFQEVRFGKLVISPAGILEGLLAFLLLMAFTRFVQGLLERKIFPKTRLDFGLQHSIRSGLGYLGFALAAMLSISVMGFDLSNLAIIAGALSVGIGFGLQNIVNNFISGLILLVERPIKAGDWVVVGDHQGIVRKISVRATEITTFDRTTVFIPNSSLISGSVQNKTHPDRVGRIILPLVVDSGQDPSAIEQLVIEIARSLPEIRKSPAPCLSVTGFGDASLRFELIVFVHEVENVREVTSVLYRKLIAAFKAHGIRETPAPVPLQVKITDGAKPPSGKGE